MESVLRREPVFAITADMDWASEAAIARLLDAFGPWKITPTLFVTHRSALLSACAAAGTAELAIHPNFLPGSTHGRTPDEIVAHVRALVPNARGTRSHAYAMSSHIIRALRPHVEYDSSPMLYLNRDIRPLRHGSGLVHYPVFWEDDVHWEFSDDWRFPSFRPLFETPGLKIVNLHPFFFALNVPDQAFYAKHKGLIQGLTQRDIARLRMTGAGCADFTMAMLEWIAGSGCRCMPLGSLHDWHLGQVRGAPQALQ